MNNLKKVWKDPVYPVTWGKNQAGMQAGQSVSRPRKALATALWYLSSKVACIATYGLLKAGIHKQWANRLLEPYSEITVVLTGTEFENFFNLRCHSAAQPEINILAVAMRKQMSLSTPNKLKEGQWHLPFVPFWMLATMTNKEALDKSVASCARTSYNNHDKTSATLAQNKALADMLWEEQHLSTMGHQAKAIGDTGYYTHTDRSGAKWCANLKGWTSWRHDRPFTKL
jgi:hypothetical protein